MKIVLASQSPRRRDLLSLTGFGFETLSTDIDESLKPGELPLDYVRRMSVEKAQTAAALLNSDVLVIASDTSVVDGNDVLGKPENGTDASRMLEHLRGREHSVMTAVTMILHTGSKRELTQVAVSPVQMRNYSEQEIEAYIATGDPFDKAGSYAIQHEVFRPVEGFNHCFANVMGLPLCHVTRMLRQFDVDIPLDIAAACQDALAYDCPVFEEILQG